MDIPQPISEKPYSHYIKYLENKIKNDCDRSMSFAAQKLHENIEGDINNIVRVSVSVDGYHEFVFQPTETSHGGTGFYLKDYIDYVERTDLDLSSVGDFETSFIEIKFPKKKNLILGCIYRHPTSKISIHDFNQCFLEPLLQKINSENKQCVLMGDFNIDLLKCETHENTDAFLNNLSSSFFSPYILQPTRLASKTLIDNIFFNSLEYHT